MKGFMDEIPREYEEAALVDGYTRMQAFWKIVLPEAVTGIAATAVFCFIIAWNEYAFALIMTNRRAQTAPPFIPAQVGSGLTDWTTIAAGTFLFLLPVAIFTFALYPHLTAFDNIAFPLRATGESRAEIERKVKDVAASLRIEPLLSKRPSALSGGDLQRVAIGRALVRRPKALLMDEPIGALDAKLREDMRAELKRLHIENGTTSVYVTHDQVEAMSLADRVAVMNDGVLQQVGTPSEVYLRPVNLFVAQFVGSPVMNIVPAEIRSEGGETGVAIGGGPAFVFPGDLGARIGAKLPSGHDLVVGVRPEAVKVAREEAPGLRPVEAHFIEPLGSHDIVDLKVGDRLIKARTPSGFVKQPGEGVWARLDAPQVHFFDATTGNVLDLELVHG
jgi:multiple sugar transport system ATP-binding protein